jgi:hypothetical protein
MAEISRWCQGGGNRNCDYDAIETIPALKTLAGLEAIVEAMPNAKDKDEAAQDIGDVSYGIFSDEELDRVSKCVDCIFHFCPNYDFIRQSYLAGPGKIVERSE